MFIIGYERILQNNYKYISCADYFIEKNNSSLLSSMCEEYLESKSKGINKSFTGLTENGNDVRKSFFQMPRSEIFFLLQ